MLDAGGCENVQKGAPPLKTCRRVLHLDDLFNKIEQMARHPSSRPPSLGEFELMVLLALIRLGDEAYGVPISHEIEQCSGREAVLGSVYAALDRLEEKGLVRSRLGDPTAARGGRAKRYFRTTQDGMRAVRETQRVLTSLWSGIPALEGGPA